MDPQDDRLGQAEPTAAAPAARATRRRPAAQQRAAGDRGLGERGIEDRGANVEDDRLTADEQDALAIFMESLQQSVLPDLPKIPGFHVCWLTTSNLRDTIAYRERIGYSPVRRAEVHGWQVPNLKTGEVDDLIRVNEMVAYKIPMRLFERMMEELHHRRPQQEEEKLRANVERQKQALEQVGSRVVEVGDGTAEIVQRPAGKPVFAD